MEYTAHPSPVSSRPSLQLQHQAYTTRLQRDRESEGRCGICGVQTHRLYYRNTGSGSVLCKDPLDIEGEVHRGRCLLCHPLQQDDFTVHSGSAASCAFPFGDTSPDQVFHFPFMMQQHQQPTPQQMMFPPLPLQPDGRIIMPQQPTPSIIQSLPHRDIPSILTPDWYLHEPGYIRTSAHGNRGQMPGASKNASQTLQKGPF